MAERHRPGNWFALAGALAALGALGMYVGGLQAARVQPLRLWANRWFDVGFALAVIAALAAVVGIMFMFAYREPSVRYRAEVGKETDGMRRLLLKRLDGKEVGYASCTVRAKDKGAMRANPIASGKTVIHTFPDDFKDALPKQLELGTHRVLWRVSTRGTQPFPKFGNRPTTRSRFKVTPAIRDRAFRVWRRGRYHASHQTEPNRKVRLKLFRYNAGLGMLGCYVSRHLPDGTFDKPFLGILDERVEGPEGTEGTLVFPDEFRRKIGEVRKPVPAGTIINDQFDYPSGEVGEYIVAWAEVWYVQSGAFEAAHEVTMEDFRRERYIAWDYFTLPGHELTDDDPNATRTPP